MTGFVVTAAALAMVAAAFLAAPLWTRAFRRGSRGASDVVRAYSAQLGQLRGLHEAGVLSADQYRQSKAMVEGKVLAALADPAAHPAFAGAPSPRLALVLALFVAVFAAAGYAWLGSPASLALGPASGASALAGDPSDNASAPHPLVPEQVEAMVDQLAKRLQDQPDDAGGWLMLARSLVVLGKHAQAVDAFKEATRRQPDDAGVLADYADALAVAQGRHLDGEPTRLVERALQVDPSNAKALALAGTAAFDRHDYAAAVRHWEKLVQTAPDDTFAQQIRAGIAEARQLSGASVEPTPAGASVTRALSPGTVSGTVSLAAPLQSRTAPDDTVFVVARAAEGSRMPLAILRKRVRDLPLQFTLDDSMAMTDTARLSGAQRVVVVARVSRSGNAMPQSGDLQGTLGAVSVGSTGLQIEINQEVSK